MSETEQAREVFIKRWRTHVAGLAIYGSVSELRDGPLAKASKWYEIPDQVEGLLGLMFEHAVKLLDKPLPVKPEAPKQNNVPAQRPAVKT